MYSFSIEDEFSARIRKKIDPRQPNPLNIDIRPFRILWNLLTSFSNRI